MDSHKFVQSSGDWPGGSPGVAIIDAIAKLEDLESIELPERLEFTLYDHLDPEALDSLVTGTGGVTVSLELVGYNVRITETKLELWEIDDP